MQCTILPRDAQVPWDPEGTARRGVSTTGMRNHENMHTGSLLRRPVSCIYGTPGLWRKRPIYELLSPILR